MSSNISPKPVSVALTPCMSYHRPEVEEAVRLVFAEGQLLRAIPGGRGSVVLVKPNLLRASLLSCTHAEVVRALCLCLQEEGIKVMVADSPGFGTATGVAESIGLAEALRPLGLCVQALDKPSSVPLRALTGGRAVGAGLGSFGVSRWALECDALISVPRVKAHCQMRLTLSVKNLFGCVCGLRKGVAHTVQGQRLEDFAAALLALWKALPPAAALVDGITAMHVTGPSGGQPYELGLVGASSSAMAMDTALYAVLQVQPSALPLWHAAQKADVFGALPEHVRYPLAQPENFSPENFVIPQQLIDISFRPHRLLISLARRLWMSWKH